MMQTGDDTSSRRKPCPSGILSITNLALNGLDSNPGIRGDRPAKIRLSHGKDFQIRKKKKVKVLLYQMLPDIRKRSSFGQGSQASPVCPYGRGNV